MAGKRWTDSRKITERIYVEGELALETPAHFGSGDVDTFTDMPLLMDDENRPLLPGTSIAGALRNYLREWEYGYRNQVDRNGDQDSLSVCLFGGVREDEEGSQSALIVDDAVFKPTEANQTPGIELRDGVTIDPVTRTAEERKKFDIELLEAGTTFQIGFELLVQQADHGSRCDREKLLCALAIALGGLERGEIALGKRKTRGYGRCRVSEWQITRYDLRQDDGLLAWLTADHPDWGPAPRERSGEKIAELLGVSDQLDQHPDRREIFTLNARFQLDGSVLIRSGAGPNEEGLQPDADAIHLHSKRGNSRKPVLPGTSLAGVLRHRALRIAKTLAEDEQRAYGLIEGTFGPEPSRDDEGESGEETALKASRLITEETVIDGGHLLVQSRIRIDRFTGGAYETALFNEAPVFGGPDSRVSVKLSLKNPQEEEMGLLLLLLKDLWSGDLPVGGEASVGRGRLQGLEAILERRSPETTQRWTITRSEQDGQLEIDGEIGRLEAYVSSLKEAL